MSTSGSTSSVGTGADFITDALNLLGVLAEEEPLQAYDLQRGLRFQTRMFKQWETRGIGSWLKSRDTLALVQGTASYLFGAGGAYTTVPFEIVSCRMFRTSDIPMERLTGDRYDELPNKTTQGFPTQFYYDRQRDNGTLYFWPVPDSAAYTAKFTFRRRIMDMINGPDNADIPPEWEKAIVENLAYDLINIYGKAGSDEAAKIARDAPLSFALIQGFDVGEEEGSLMIVPDGWGR